MTRTTEVGGRDDDRASRAIVLRLSFDRRRDDASGRIEDASVSMRVRVKEGAGAGTTDYVPPQGLALRVRVRPREGSFAIEGPHLDLRALVDLGTVELTSKELAQAGASLHVATEVAEAETTLAGSVLALVSAAGVTEIVVDRADGFVATSTLAGTDTFPPEQLAAVVELVMWFVDDVLKDDPSRGPREHDDDDDDDRGGGTGPPVG